MEPMATSSSNDTPPPSVVVKVDFKQRQPWWFRYWPPLLVGSLCLIMVVLGGLYTLTVMRQHQLQTLANDNRQTVESNRLLESKLLEGQSFNRMNSRLQAAPGLQPAKDKVLVKLPKAACHLVAAPLVSARAQTPALARVYGY
jgi:hypothetical protein